MTQCVTAKWFKRLHGKLMLYSIIYLTQIDNSPLTNLNVMVAKVLQLHVLMCERQIALVVRNRFDDFFCRQFVLIHNLFLLTLS